MSAGKWWVVARGGPFDGWDASSPVEPAEVLILWTCGQGCAGHGTFDANRTDIVLRTAEPYRRVHTDVEARRAIYEPAGFDPGPLVADETLIGTGAGS